MTEQEQLEKVKENPCAIITIKNPSEKVQLEAVYRLPSAIQYIKQPSKKVKIAAVTNMGEAIRYIKKPSEEVSIIALKQDGGYIRYIENPSEKLQFIAVQNSMVAIDCIENPTRKVQCEAFSILFEYDRVGSLVGGAGKELFFYLGTFQEGNFFLSLPAYRNELRDIRYFESLLVYLMVYREKWIEKYLKTLTPLTKAQQDIWKKYRLKTLL